MTAWQNTALLPERERETERQRDRERQKIEGWTEIERESYGDESSPFW